VRETHQSAGRARNWCVSRTRRIGLPGSAPGLSCNLVMQTINWKRFRHPGGVYHLEYPAHWEQLEKDGARSCGFGPHDRDDVGLWISVMPVSVDTARLAEELPRMLSEVIPAGGQGGNVRRDPTLRHHGVKADVQTEGQGG